MQAGCAASDAQCELPLSLVVTSLPSAGEGSTLLLGQAARADNVPALKSVYFYSSCAFAGSPWLDPQAGLCASKPNPKCAHGSPQSPDGCRECPNRALCPGGTRIWPLPGFWSDGVSFASFGPCAPPDWRCLGWDAAAGAAGCGPGYRNATVRCLGCDTGYFTDGSICSACPVGDAGAQVSNSTRGTRGTAGAS